LHLTMQFLGDFARFPADLINHVSRAAKCIKHSSFGFVLDRLGAFPGHRPPYVLLCSARTVSALRKFRLELVEAIAAESVALQASRFIPHVTLAYGNRQLADPVPIDPIEWNVTEFVLIDSHVGMARHEILDRWPLRSPSART